MRKLLIITIALLGLSELASAQQNPQYSLFLFNKQTINPAYVGSRGSLSINMDYRTQWVKANGNPETFNIGVHSPLGKGALVPRLAAGILFSNENLGAQTRNTFSGQLAYRVPVSDNSILSFGLEGSLYAFSYRTNELRADEDDDATVAALADNLVKPNFSAGVYLYNPRYYVGFSSMLLLNQEKDVNELNDLAFRRHYFAMAGYLQPVTDFLKLRLNVIGKYVYLQELNESPSALDINLAGIINDRFLVGASYRTDRVIVAMAQFQVNDFLNIAYGYDFKSRQYTTMAGVSHEIYLGIDIAGKAKSLTSPRFVTYF